jgi:Cu/Ag efflux protein CusF
MRGIEALKEPTTVENPMRKLCLVAPLALALTVAAFAHDGRPSVAGVITKIDEKAGEITLKHEAIPNLDMEAMTMGYKVKDPAMLKGLKSGDKVKFEAEEVNGEANVVEIEKAK